MYVFVCWLVSVRTHPCWLGKVHHCYRHMDTHAHRYPKKKKTYTFYTAFDVAHPDHILGLISHTHRIQAASLSFCESLILASVPFHPMHSHTHTHCWSISLFLCGRIVRCNIWDIAILYYYYLYTNVSLLSSQFIWFQSSNNCSFIDVISIYYYIEWIQLTFSFNWLTSDWLCPIDCLTLLYSNCNRIRDWFTTTSRWRLLLCIFS